MHMDNYGKYKNIRDASWRCLLDYNIDRLPVNLIQITIRSGIKVLRNSDVNELSGNEIGTTLFTDDGCYIIFDDECTPGRARFTVAHEIAHVLLGHVHKENPSAEEEANMFAARILAPACVLWGLRLHSAREIAQVCDISMSAAAIRAERMAILYQRDKFLRNPLEKKVYRQFSSFVNSFILT